MAIIRSAQNLNLSAQNALLKILEEPPERAVIILVTEDQKKLLPTIVSRCQIKQFALLSEIELGEMANLNVLNMEELIFWSLGRPGFLRNMLDDGEKLEERREIMIELKNIFSMTANEKLSLAEQFAKNTPVLFLKMDFWSVLLRSVILGQKSFLVIDPTKALKLIEKIEESKKIIGSTNSNVRLVVENLLLIF